MTRNNLGRRGFMPSDSLQSITEGSQSRSGRENLGGMLLMDVFLTACSACFLYNSGPFAQWCSFPQ